ncbi:hypothetical protein [Hymenobacter sp.]|uniref:hypothetical protein n=1 Tax=Hymenobacter sp. TaxID=1898978 RepID=UPI00286A54C4|nr:hypothetical protein [Hymenobacter sp.]
MKMLSTLLRPLTLLLLMGGAFAATSCEKEDSVNVNQDRIFSEFSLVYNKAQDKTYARAAFKFGNLTGTGLQLSAPSEVRFGNDVLTFVPLLNYYEKQFAGQLPQGGTFTFKDTDGKTFVNAVPAPVAVELPASLVGFAKGSAYTVAWDGAPVAASETVDVTIDGAGQSDPIQVILQSAVGSTSLIVAASNLAPLLNGPAQAFTNRTRIVDQLQQGPSAGGRIVSRYEGAPKTVPVQ